jgi:DNA-binding transcriptional LysR family regulator
MLNQIDLSRVDLNLLTLFEVVLAEGHVGRAADRMHLSPSAVSHGLGRLRKLLNDPLFLKTPKGVTPTTRALELAQPIAQVLTQVRSVMTSVEPFNPASSTRRFLIGSPDGTSAVFLPPLLKRLRSAAPGINIGVRQLLPMPAESEPERAWRFVFAQLDAREMDIAVLPLATAPARFHQTVLFEEDFVIAMRAGHAFAKAPTLKNYCRMQHLMVSLSGDAQGFVDHALAAHGLSRRVALTVPNFMSAIATVAETDLIAALPRRFAALHAQRFGVVCRESPIELARFALCAFLPKVALMDAGVAWLLGLLGEAVGKRQT